MNLIKFVYRKTMPFRFRRYIAELRRKLHLLPVDEHLQRVKEGKWMKTHRAECEYMIKNGGVMAFPYAWTEEHKESDIKVYLDRNNRMRYVLVNGRRMYFPRCYSKEEVQEYFNFILIEQDPRSPHYYFNSSDEKLRNSTFLDIGGAEGYITLSVLPFVKNAIIFECDKKWFEALNATFEAYHDKVEIIHRFVGEGKTNDNTIKVDDIVKNRDHVVLKIDVEGMEKEVLSGAAETLNKADTKVFVCTYHKKDDEKELGELLKKHGFQIQISDGWMYFGDTDASFRRGIIRAEKSLD